MAVYFKFKSAKDFDSVPIDGHFISVGHLKEKIFESKHLGRGTDFDLIVSNPQTNEEYADEAMLIPKHASVLVRRIPGRPRKPIVTEPNEPKMKENNQFEETEMIKNNLPVAESSNVRVSEEAEWDEFGNDLYAIPDMLPQQSSSQLQEAVPPPSRADEDSKIKALIDTSALDWQRQTQEFGSGRGFGRGLGGRMMTGRGFGRGAGPDKKTPPQSYICYRCKVPGHFIQHCPTNGDPNYDLRKVKPPTGIPKSMLVATLEGSCTLPSGAVAVLKPNEAAFEKEIEGIPSTKPVGDLPPELHCPLCKKVMEDAVLTSKCCFNSFCDKCIRDYIISRFICVCGATNILADDLLPNKTLRETISRILESTTSSGENGGSLQVQDMESARFALPKVSSPTLSATAKEGRILPPQSEGGSMKEAVSEGKAAVSAPQLSVDWSKATKQPDASEATLGSPIVKEQASRGSAPMVKEEVQQKLPDGEPGKKKKKKKVRDPNDMQWRMPQDLATESFGMPICPSTYNPYWGGMQCGMDGYMAPYGNTISYMGFAPDPFVLPFGAGMSPQYPFGGQGYMMPGVPPPRDFNMGSRHVPPVMSREEFEARKADLRRKREREIDKHGERESRNKDLAKDVSSSSADVSSGKSKSKSSSHASRRRHDTDPTVSGKPTRPRLLERKVMTIGRGTPRPPLLYTQPLTATTASSRPACSDASAFRVQKVQPASGLANGSHRGQEVVHSSSGGHRASSNGKQHHHQKDDWKAAPSSTMITGGSWKSSLYDQESSDEAYRFKRRRLSRHESAKYEEEPRHRRGSREREHGSKHRRNRSELRGNAACLITIL